MSFYEEHILPVAIDFACGLKPIRMQREKIVPRATGEVLEVGSGSGLNTPYFRSDAVTKLWALEPSEGMRKKARKRLLDSNLNVEFIDLPGEEIPLEDASVDTVLSTFTLCTIPDVEAALAGMRRVLKPQGRLLFCEHGAAPDSDVRRRQDRWNRTWGKFTGGCNLNRDIPALISAAGFEIEDQDAMYVPGPKFAGWQWWGAASIR